MKFGVIGGSGLYDASWLGALERLTVETPFGKPSGDILKASKGSLEVYFLPRHGEGHTVMPSEINHRANIYAMKSLGVTHILSVSAVGSLKEDLAPGDVVVVDQYIDRTKRGGEHTFFGGGVVAHVAFGHPVCPELARLAKHMAAKAIAELHPAGGQALGGRVPKAVLGGTYVNMEGPAFSTRAESLLYRSWGADVIGMTNLGEAKLAREAEICYCTMAMVTDYDCWHPGHDHVTVDAVRAVFAANVALAKRAAELTAAAAEALPRSCPCPSALDGAVITDLRKAPPEALERLRAILGARAAPPSA